MRSRQEIQEMFNKLFSIHENGYYELDREINLYHMENYYDIKLNDEEISRKLERIAEWADALDWALGSDRDIESINRNYDEMMELYEMYKVVRDENDK